MSSEKTAKPNYEEAQELVALIGWAQERLRDILTQEPVLKAHACEAAQRLYEEKLRATLEQIEVEQVNKDKQGVRVSVLREAGFRNIWQLSGKSLRQLQAINGIGDQSAVKIKAAVDEITAAAEAGTGISLSADGTSQGEDALVQALYRVLNAQATQRESLALYQTWLLPVQASLAAAKRAKNAISWLFSSPEKKRLALEALEELRTLRSSEYYHSATRLAGDFYKVMHAGPAEYRADFAGRSAAYYAVLEELGSRYTRSENLQSGLPAQLVQQVAAYPLELKFFKSTLRRYQYFGVQYILCQGNVLLGDEMGLGKTVQAIAAMTVLAAGGQTHFMVICPAGVLVNWCREIATHSTLRAVKIHGEDIPALEEWLRGGGVAITTYESVSRFGLPDNFTFSMLVVDEAHYIKNPEALRTRAAQYYSAHAERLLYMTGTPLENNVDEMCFLVHCLQPEVAQQVEEIKYLSTAPQFREKLAPVYLRRTRTDVLKELPELTKKDAWCDLRAEEAQAYYAAVMSGNFMAMRQVSWQMEDLRLSSKAARLLDICEMAESESRRVLVFSFFRETVFRVCELLGKRCTTPITGSTPLTARQDILDAFAKSLGGTVLVSQVQAGGMGVNIQAASVVVFCEPQIKPSLENQAVSRTYRMGQLRNVLVYRLLCDDTVDERVLELLQHKQELFDTFANESVIGAENVRLSEKSWINAVIAQEQARLGASAEPAVIKAEGEPAPASTEPAVIKAEGERAPVSAEPALVKAEGEPAPVSAEPAVIKAEGERAPVSAESAVVKAEGGPVPVSAEPSVTDKLHS